MFRRVVSTTNTYVARLHPHIPTLRSPPSHPIIAFRRCMHPFLHLPCPFPRLSCPSARDEHTQAVHADRDSTVPVPTCCQHFSNNPRPHPPSHHHSQSHSHSPTVASTLTLTIVHPNSPLLPSVLMCRPQARLSEATPSPYGLSSVSFVLSTQDNLQAGSFTPGMNCETPDVLLCTREPTERLTMYLSGHVTFSGDPEVGVMARGDGPPHPIGPH